MAASSPSSRDSQDRSARVAGALTGALVLAALAVLLTPGSRRGLGALMVLIGLLAGVAVTVAGLLTVVGGSRRRPVRSAMERLNDAAFVVVLAAVSLLLGITARPWTMVLPGLLGGALAGRALRQPPDRQTDVPPDQQTPPSA